LFGLPPRAVKSIASAWEFIYSAGADPLGGVNVLYVLVPWIGVMAAGYGFGLIMERPREDRDRILVRIGLAATALFLVLGTVAALLVNAIRTGATGSEWYSTAPYTRVPEQWRWPLWLLYSVFAVDVGLLYLSCRWYARVKAERPRAWMRYI